MNRLRIASIVAIGALVALLIAPSSVGAVPTAPTAAPPIATDQNGTCPLFDFGGHLTGVQGTTSNISASRHGASGILTFSYPGFSICNGPSQNSGPLAYVAIQPRDEPAGSGNVGIGFGVIHCTGIPIPLGFCTNQLGAPHTIIWYRACGTSYNTIVDVGATTYGTHQYTFWGPVNGWWQFNLDGHQVAGLLDSRVNCWSNGLNKAVWTAERWTSGDSIGNEPGGRLWWDSLSYGILNQGWYDANLCGATCPPCSFVQSDDVCHLYQDSRTYAWTVG